MVRDITNPLDYLFYPRSIAVIGASSTPGKWGFNILNRLITSSFQLKPMWEAEMPELPPYFTLFDRKTRYIYRKIANTIQRKRPMHTRGFGGSPAFPAGYAAPYSSA